LSDLSRKIAAAAAAGAMALAGTITTTGVASAAPPRCDAPSGYNCLAIENATRDAYSFRANGSGGGRCLTNHSPGRTGYHPDVHLQGWATPILDSHTHNYCGGEQRNYGYSPRWEGRWTILRVG
jgi:hypothetical protein